MESLNTSEAPCAVYSPAHPRVQLNVLLTSVNELIHIECGESTEREVAAALYTRLQRDREIIIQSLSHMA